MYLKVLHPGQIFIIKKIMMKRGQKYAKHIYHIERNKYFTQTDQLEIVIIIDDYRL